jgi:hypothetical protein
MYLLSSSVYLAERCIEGSMIRFCFCDRGLVWEQVIGGGNGAFCASFSPNTACFGGSWSGSNTRGFHLRLTYLRLRKGVESEHTVDPRWFSKYSFPAWEEGVISRFRIRKTIAFRTILVFCSLLTFGLIFFWTMYLGRWGYSVFVPMACTRFWICFGTSNFF